MGSRERMPAARDVRILPDCVLQEPEAGCRVACIVVPIHTGVRDPVPIGRIVIQGSEGVNDVVLGLRLRIGEQPWSLLDARYVFGTAALEDVVLRRVHPVGHELTRSGCIVCRENVAPVVAAHRIVVSRIGVELEEPAGERISITRAALAWENIRRYYRADGDRGGRAGGQRRDAGGQHVACTQGGRVKRAGGYRPRQKVGVGQRIGDHDTGRRSGAVIVHGNRERRRVAWMDGVWGSKRSSLRNRQVREQGHACGPLSRDDVSERAEILSQSERHGRDVRERGRISGVDGPRFGKGERPTRCDTAAPCGDRIRLQIAEKSVGKGVSDIARGQHQVGTVRRTGVVNCICIRNRCAQLSGRRRGGRHSQGG